MDRRKKTNTLTPLITLTSQADIDSLIQTFCQYFHERFPDEPLELISEYVPRVELNSRNLSQCIDMFLQAASEFQANLPARQEGMAGAMMQFALHTSHGSIAQLQTPSVDAATAELIAAYIAVFINQISLLSRNERDALTGILNRQALDKKISRLSHRHQHNRKSDNAPPRECVFALLDIDFFKRVNDTFGHLYGDEVLILFAQCLKNSVREQDKLFRYGGEEFAILLQDCELDVADGILERVRSNIEAFPFPQIEGITCSIGYTRFDSYTPASISIEHADRALYYAKQHGRNQAHSYEALLADKRIEEKLKPQDRVEIFETGL